MVEYSIKVINKGGTPYYIDRFNSFESCLVSLMQIVQLEEDRGRSFFVDNDFFENKYICNNVSKYLQVCYRDVTNWCSFQKNENFNNIVYLNFK